MVNCDDLTAESGQRAVIELFENDLNSNLKTLILRSETAEILLAQRTFDQCQTEIRAEVERLIVDGGVTMNVIADYRYIIRNRRDPRVANVLENVFQGALKRLLIEQRVLVRVGIDTSELHRCNMMLCQEWMETLNIFKLDCIVPYAVGVISEWESNEREP